MESVLHECNRIVIVAAGCRKIVIYSAPAPRVPGLARSRGPTPGAFAGGRLGVAYCARSPCVRLLRFNGAT
jgi:hypothetical protein